MTRRLLLPMLLLLVALTGCRWLGPSGGPAATCTPPPGGRCAADVAWTGPIRVTPDGLRLHGTVPCGGVLRATESATRFTIRLHVGAMGPGSLSCALVDVGVRLDTPLGHRVVVDAVGGGRVHVVGG